MLSQWWLWRRVDFSLESWRLCRSSPVKTWKGVHSSQRMRSLLMGFLHGNKAFYDVALPPCLEPSLSLLCLYHNIQLYSALSSLSLWFVHTTYFAACLKSTLRFKSKFNHYFLIESFLVSVPKAMYRTSPPSVSPNTSWHLSVFPSSPSSIEPHAFIVANPWRLKQCLAQWEVYKYVFYV